MSFQEMYRRTLIETSSGITQSDSPRWSNTLVQPSKVNAEVWGQLADYQKARRCLQRVRNTVLAQAESGNISELEFMRMTHSDIEISDKAGEIVFGLLKENSPRAPNPSVSSLVRNVANAVKEGRDIRIAASFCLDKGDEVRPGKLGYCLHGGPIDREISLFVKGVETKGFTQFSNILKTIDYPVQLTIFLGDMDYLTLDRCGHWCSVRSLERMRDEVCQAREQLEAQYKSLLPESDVRVRLWSEMYDCASYEEHLELAKDLNHWCEPEKLIEESISIYVHQWGYGALARKEGLSPEQLRRFIIGDLTRTAAQYRLEADVLRQLGAIQVWAEKVPSPTWPMRVSCYDGSEYLPSLLL